jgi:hypothetical protein
MREETEAQRLETDVELKKYKYFWYKLLGQGLPFLLGLKPD